MEENPQIYNIDLIVKDYIRTLQLPSENPKKPVAVLLVGIPASGKSYLAQNLASTIPIVLLSENDIQSFLVPKVSFFERGQDVITQFSKEVIKSLTSWGYSCILDANLRFVETRLDFGAEIEKLGGQVIVIHLNCPKKVAYGRIRKRNLEIVTGESEGFVMDWDYFQYEINTTQTPISAERALTYDSSKRDHQFERIVAYLKKKMGLEEL